MKEKPWIINALLQSIIIVLLLFALNLANKLQQGQETEHRHRARIELLMSQPLKLGSPLGHAAEIDPAEVREEFRSLRKEMIETSFANRCGGQSKEESIDRLQAGIAAAEDFEQSILERMGKK
jgi:hypothetical protein